MRKWATTDKCQLCFSAVGTAAHRFCCSATTPAEGWSKPPAEAALALGALSARRKEILKLNGLLAIKVSAPVRCDCGWLRWAQEIPSDVELGRLTWYIDGSAINGRWRDIATTGYGIVVTNDEGLVVGCAQGLPPAWIRTAAASEAWALLQVLKCCIETPFIVTDCKSLLTVASNGTVRATGSKQPLARIWSCIAATLDGDITWLTKDNKLRWVPAHLGEAAVGTFRACGREFTATDWRANRLADALAKNVSRFYAIEEEDEKMVKSAEAAAKHACTLLGAVTHAANHLKIECVNANGETVYLVKRDSIDEKPKKTITKYKHAIVTSGPLESCDLLEVQTSTRALFLAACANEPKEAKIQDWAALRKSREATRRESDLQACELRTAELAVELNARCKPREALLSVSERSKAMLLRVRSKQAAASQTTQEELH